MSSSDRAEWLPVTRLIDQVLVEHAKLNDRDNTHFHPSEFYGCKRRIAYKYYEAKGSIKIERQDANPRQQRIFDNGTWMHSRWTHYVSGLKTLYGKWKCEACHKIQGVEEKLGILRPEACSCGSKNFSYVENGFLSEELAIGGHVDAIIGTKIEIGGRTYILEPDCEFIIIDYKSMNPFQFPDLKAPLSSHNTQMQVYLMLTGLKVGRFIYENKGNQDVAEFRVVRDDAFIDELKKQALALKYIVTHKKSNGKFALPRRSSDATAKEDEFVTRSCESCKVCDYRGHCWPV